MNRYLAPFRRSFGLELRSFLPSRRSHELPLLPSYPPAYDEITGCPRRTSTPTELQPPDYEIAIQFPPFGVPPPTYAEVLNSLIENTVEAGRLQSPTQNAPVETDRIPNPENHRNGAPTEFVSIEMPGYSNVRYSRNGTSDSNTRPQVNGGITNTVVAANLFNIENRNYYRSIYDIPLINSSEAATFLKRAIFTILVVLGMIYFRTSHPEWMPHWAFVVVLCLLILSLIQHLPPVFRDYRDSSPRNDC